jgi:hypothetical protein
MVSTNVVEEFSANGYAVVRGWLSPTELELLVAALPKSAASPENPGVAASLMRFPKVLIEEIHGLRDKIEGTARLIQPGADSDPKLYFGAWFQSKTLKYPWHQDARQTWLFQNQAHELNFWMPVVKPHRETGNVSFIPYSGANQELLQAFAGRGARVFASQAGKTVVHDHYLGGRRVFDFDLEALAVTPELLPGDLLLHRGDMIHRTHPKSDEQRIAVGYRTLNSRASVRRDRLLGGASVHKLAMMCRDPKEAYWALGAFDTIGKPEISVGELFSCVRNPELKRIGPAEQLLDELLTFQIANQPDPQLRLVGCVCPLCRTMSETLARSELSRSGRIRIESDGCCQNGRHQRATEEH